MYYRRPLLLTSHCLVAFSIVSFTVSEVCAEQYKGFILLLTAMTLAFLRTSKLGRKTVSQT